MLVNKTAVTQIVKIQLADGTKDSINLQPRGRAVPPKGSIIDPKVYPTYLSTVQGVEDYAPQQE